MLLKPRFGKRMWSGIWPPSKPNTDTPERDLAPFWPRPAVLPRPEPMPRPTRTRDLRAPLLSLRSLSFMSLHSLSLWSRHPLPFRGEGEPPGRRRGSGGGVRGTRGLPLSPTLSPDGEREFRLCLFRHPHHMLHLADHAAHLGGVLQLHGAM